MQSNSSNLDASNRQVMSVNEQNNLPSPSAGPVIVNTGTINGNVNTKIISVNAHTLD